MSEKSSSIQIQYILAFFGFLGRAGPGRGILGKVYGPGRAGPDKFGHPYGPGRKIWTPNLNTMGINSSNTTQYNPKAMINAKDIME